MSQSNGVTVIPTEKTTDREPYRPPASTVKVREEIVSSFGRIVSEALSNGANFVALAYLYDRDESTAVRYGHLVDASECLEIALEHLGQLKSTLAYVMRVEDDNNIGSDGPIPF